MSDEPPMLRPSPHSEPESSVGCMGYGIGGVSFIPLIGVPFGVVAIIWGFIKRSWPLAIMGACGILVSVVLYGGLFYFGFYQRGGVYDGMRQQLAVKMLDDTVKNIEFYKLQHGRYPATLGELSPDGKPPGVIDPTAFQRLGPLGVASSQRTGGKSLYFFYELDPSGSFYFLRSVGPDGVPFTGDDIVPSLSAEERKNTGLRLER